VIPMDLSESEIKKIAEIISLRLGPDASPDEIRSLVAHVIEELAKGETKGADFQASAQTMSCPIPRKLVVNALGPDRDDFDEKLKSFFYERGLKLMAISDSRLENLRSVIAIIDYTDFAADINSLKFELSSLCEDSGFKAVVQDSGYYGI